MTTTDWLLLAVLLVQFMIIWSVWNLTNWIKKGMDFSKEDDTVRKATEQVKTVSENISDVINKLKG